MKVIIEIVRSAFILSLTAFLASVLFTFYWLFQRYNYNSTARGTRVPAFAKAYGALGTQAWLWSHAWLFIDIGLALLTLLLGFLWRRCVRIRNARKEAQFLRSRSLH